MTVNIRQCIFNAKRQQGLTYQKLSAETQICISRLIDFVNGKRNVHCHELERIMAVVGLQLGYDHETATRIIGTMDPPSPEPEPDAEIKAE